MPAHTKPWPIEMDVYFLVASDEDNDPLVYLLKGPNGEDLPLVAIDDDGLAFLRKHAQATANACGRSVNIISFTAPSIYETVRPLQDSTGD